MSVYTIGEIVVWLLLAAALGMALGWLLRELQCRRDHGASPAATRTPIGEVSTPTAPTPAAQSRSGRPPLIESADTPVKKVPVKKVPVKKVPVKKVPAKKVPVKKVPAKKVPAKKVPAKKVPAKKVPVKKVPVKKVPVKKVPRSVRR